MQSAVKDGIGLLGPVGGKDSLPRPLNKHSGKPAGELDEAVKGACGISLAQSPTWQ